MGYLNGKSLSFKKVSIIMGKVAAIQSNASGSVEENLMVLEAQITKAVSAGAELVLLPEHCIGQPINILELTENFGDGIGQAAFANMAKKYRIWVVVGAMPIRMPDGHIYSTSLVYNSEGECVAHYNKMHLCHVTLDTAHQVQESDRFMPGKQIVAADTPVGRVGLSICYDLRFPELYRELSNDGVTILLIPAAFLAYTGKSHWEVLLRARAIENTCYVVAANQYGALPNGYEMYGYSQIVSPWGDVLDCLSEGDGFVTADIEGACLQDIRSRLPALEHRSIRSSGRA